MLNRRRLTPRTIAASTNAVSSASKGQRRVLPRLAMLGYLATLLGNRWVLIQCAVESTSPEFVIALWVQLLAFGIGTRFDGSWGAMANPGVGKLCAVVLLADWIGNAALRNFMAISAPGFSTFPLAVTTLLSTMAMASLLLRTRYSLLAWGASITMMAGVCVCFPPDGIPAISWLVGAVAFAIPALGMVVKEMLLRGDVLIQGRAKRKPIGVAAVAFLSAAAQLLMTTNWQAPPVVPDIGSVCTLVLVSGVFRLALAWTLRAGSSSLVQFANVLAMPIGAASLTMCHSRQFGVGLSICVAGLCLECLAPGNGAIGVLAERQEPLVPESISEKDVGPNTQGVEMGQPLDAAQSAQKDLQNTANTPPNLAGELENGNEPVVPLVPEPIDDAQFADELRTTAYKMEDATNNLTQPDESADAPSVPSQAAETVDARIDEHLQNVDEKQDATVSAQHSGEEDVEDIPLPIKIEQGNKKLGVAVEATETDGMSKDGDLQKVSDKTDLAQSQIPEDSEILEEPQEPAAPAQVAEKLPTAPEPVVGQLADKPQEAANDNGQPDEPEDRKDTLEADEPADEQSGDDTKSAETQEIAASSSQKAEELDSREDPGAQVTKQEASELSQAEEEKEANDVPTEEKKDEKSLNRSFIEAVTLVPVLFVVAADKVLKVAKDKQPPTKDKA